MYKREIIWSVIAFSVGVYVGADITARAASRILERRSEMLDLYIDLFEYITSAGFDDSVSGEEYERVIREKREFIEFLAAR